MAIIVCYTSHVIKVTKQHTVLLYIFVLPNKNTTTVCLPTVLLIAFLCCFMVIIVIINRPNNFYIRHEIFASLVIIFTVARQRGQCLHVSENKRRTQVYVKSYAFTTEKCHD